MFVSVLLSVCLSLSLCRSLSLSAYIYLLYIYLHTDIPTYMHAYIQKHIQTHVPTKLHVNIQKQTNTHTYIHIQSSDSVPALQLAQLLRSLARTLGHCALQQDVPFFFFRARCGGDMYTGSSCCVSGLRCEYKAVGDEELRCYPRRVLTASFLC